MTLEARKREKRFAEPFSQEPSFKRRLFLRAGKSPFETNGGAIGDLTKKSKKFSKKFVEKTKNKSYYEVN